MLHDSFYRNLTRPTGLKHRGYDYAARGLLNRFLSSRLYGNPLIAGFLQRLDVVAVDVLDRVKLVQFYYNYTVDKNDRSLNL